MNIKDGDVVVVLGALKLKNYRADSSQLILGTFIGHVDKDVVQVLLPDGYIFTGSMREICPHSEQADAEGSA